MRQKEHTLQAWTCRFLDAVLMPPYWFTSVDHAGTDMRNVARQQALRARGVKPGVGDMYVCQMPGMSCWLELKVGSNKQSDAQIAVQASLDRCSIAYHLCRSIHDVLYALIDKGFAIHGNAQNLAREYQARVDASISEAPKKRRASAPRKPKTSISAIARFEAIRAKTR